LGRDRGVLRDRAVRWLAELLMLWLLLVILLILFLVGGFVFSPLFWIVVLVLVVAAVLGRGRF
jgi:energy-coupling factor transporter transmembrane protein EcfT